MSLCPNSAVPVRLFSTFFMTFGMWGSGGCSTSLWFGSSENVDVPDSWHHDGPSPVAIHCLVNYRAISEMTKTPSQRSKAAVSMQNWIFSCSNITINLWCCWSRNWELRRSSSRPTNGWFDDFGIGTQKANFWLSTEILKAKRLLWVFETNWISVLEWTDLHCPEPILTLNFVERMELRSFQPQISFMSSLLFTKTVEITKSRSRSHDIINTIKHNNNFYIKIASQNIICVNDCI